MNTVVYINYFSQLTLFPGVSEAGETNLRNIFNFAHLMHPPAAS